MILLWLLVSVWRGKIRCKGQCTFCFLTFLLRRRNQREFLHSIWIIFGKMILARLSASSNIKTTTLIKCSLTLKKQASNPKSPIHSATLNSNPSPTNAPEPNNAATSNSKIQSSSSNLQTSSCPKMIFSFSTPTKLSPSANKTISSNQ